MNKVCFNLTAVLQGRPDSLRTARPRCFRKTGYSGYFGYFGVNANQTAHFSGNILLKKRNTL